MSRLELHNQRRNVNPVDMLKDSLRSVDDGILDATQRIESLRPLNTVRAKRSIRAAQVRITELQEQRKIILAIRDRLAKRTDDRRRAVELAEIVTRRRGY